MDLFKAVDNCLAGIAVAIALLSIVLFVALLGVAAHV